MFSTFSLQWLIHLEIGLAIVKQKGHSAATLWPPHNKSRAGRAGGELFFLEALPPVSVTQYSCRPSVGASSGRATWIWSGSPSTKSWTSLARLQSGGSTLPGNPSPKRCFHPLAPLSLTSAAKQILIFPSMFHSSLDRCLGLLKESAAQKKHGELQHSQQCS